MYSDQYGPKVVTCSKMRIDHMLIGYRKSMFNYQINSARGNTEDIEISSCFFSIFIG